MTPEQVEELQKGISALLTKCMRLEARCDGLKIALCAVAMAAKMDDDMIAKVVDDITIADLEKRLERVKGLEPAPAAELDTSSGMPDFEDALPKDFPGRTPQPKTGLRGWLEGLLKPRETPK